MVQKEVAERICAEPPRMNRLAASVQFWAQPKIIARVPRTDFSPPPEVESAVVEFTVRAPAIGNGLPEERYYKAMRAIFAQPRKTVLNNVAAGSGGNRNEIAASLSALAIDPNSRPQDLSIEKISRIAENFFV
jgi:16S rRNA (adenine1518-N6/adenine1519-N6)-dimethyltransferase